MVSVGVFVGLFEGPLGPFGPQAKGIDKKRRKPTDQRIRMRTSGNSNRR